MIFYLFSSLSQLADTSAEAATDASEAVGEDRPAFLEAIEMTTSGEWQWWSASSVWGWDSG